MIVNFKTCAHTLCFCHRQSQRRQKFIFLININEQFTTKQQKTKTKIKQNEEIKKKINEFLSI